MIRSMRWLPFAGLFMTLAAHAAPHDPVRQELSGPWQFRLAANDPAGPAHGQARSWQAATVPGTVQTDLMALGQLVDPFYRDNEAAVQWVGLANWDYRTRFDASADVFGKKQVELVLDGLDTFADVSLNGHPLVSADNMFRRWRVPVKSWLKASGNVLDIAFHSPIRRVQPWLQKQPYAMPGAYDSAFGDEPKGRNSATYVRTAQYQYGWDWGPRIVAEGIWQPVHLEGFDAVRLDDLHVEQQRVDAGVAQLQVQLAVHASQAAQASLEVQVTPPTGAPFVVRQDVQLDAGDNALAVPVRIASPQRWFPLGYGAQSMYTFRATLRDGDRVLASGDRRTGLRSIELRRDTDAWGRGFAFVVNGIPVFAKGANVIPLDSFPNRVTPERHRAMLEAARDAHMNMVRLWGGGYYETDDFYEEADRLGIMVWQDFMFGGAILPPDPALRENARVEAVQQVMRLRDHPSIVLWAGNNEVQADWESWGAALDFKKAVSADERERVWSGNLKLFDSILRGVVEKLGGGVPYWATSPGNDFDGPSNQLNDGDYHSWKVWAGSAPVEDYLKDTPRFLSEFGLQSFPEMRTIEGFTKPEDRRMDSPVMEVHQKFGASVAPGTGNKRLLFYINQYYGEPADFAGFVYLSQLMQAEGIELAATHMRASRPHGMGVLFWQLNDVWPAASWSSIDYLGRPKALQFHARRFYNPLLVAAIRDGGTTSVSFVSDLTTAKAARWHMRLFDFDGRLLRETQGDATLAPLASTPVASFSDAQLLQGADPRRTVAMFEVMVDGKTESSSLVWFDRARALALADPHLQATITTETDGFRVSVAATTVARGAWIDFGNLDATVDDNAFDVLPGQPKSIHVTSRESVDALRNALHLRSLFDSVKH